MVRLAWLGVLAPVCSGTVLFSADCDGGDEGSGECIYTVDTTAVGVNLSFALAYTSSGKISALEVDVANDLVYWTDRTNEELWSASLSFGAVTMLQSGEGEPHDVAVRASTGDLYWTDKTDGLVYVSYDSGATMATLFEGIREPVGIEVDDDNAVLYVGDYLNGTIFTADLDDTSAGLSFFIEASYPRSILLHEGYLYWIEIGDGSDSDAVSSGSVYRCDVALAVPVKELFYDHLVDPDCLAVLGDSLLISDEDADRVVYVPFADTLAEGAQLLSGAAPRGLAAYTSTSTREAATTTLLRAAGQDVLATAATNIQSLSALSALLICGALLGVAVAKRARKPQGFATIA